MNLGLIYVGMELELSNNGITINAFDGNEKNILIEYILKRYNFEYEIEVIYNYEEGINTLKYTIKLDKVDVNITNFFRKMLSYIEEYEMYKKIYNKGFFKKNGIYQEKTLEERYNQCVEIIENIDKEYQYYKSIRTNYDSLKKLVESYKK